MVFMLGFASGAWAASFTFNFDQKVLDPSPLTLLSVAPAGTFTVSDNPGNPNWVDLRVELFPAYGGVGAFLFNYSGIPVPAGYKLVLTDPRPPGPATGILSVAPNANTPGYNFHFDLRVDVPDGAAFNKVKVYDATLKLQLIASPFTEANLDASMFNLTDDNGLYAWVHPVSFPGEQVVSYDYVANAAPVPEPATMILLGSGLVGLARFGRKFK